MITSKSGSGQRYPIGGDWRKRDSDANINYQLFEERKLDKDSTKNPSQKGPDEPNETYDILADKEDRETSQNSPYSLVSSSGPEDLLNENQISVKDIEKFSRIYPCLNELEQEKIEILVREFANDTTHLVLSDQKKSRTWDEIMDRIRSFFTDSSSYYQMLEDNGSNSGKIKKEQLKMLIKSDIQDMKSE